MAATVLNPGDIAIVGYITNPDSFSFVPLVDLSAGTEIYFTDKGWTGSSFTTTEGVVKFTVDNNITAGTVINSTEQSSDFTWENSFSGSFDLSGSGDQITVLQSSNSTNSTDPLSSDFTVIYQVDNTDTFEDATDSNTGNVVTGLSKAENTAVLLNNTAKYAAFNFDNTNAPGDIAIGSGTKEELLAAINNPENWTFSQVIEDGTTLPSGSIEVISNAAPIIGDNLLLYSGATGKLPDAADSATNAPWLDYQDSTAFLGGIATPTISQDGVTLTTDDTAYAGYTNHEVVVGLLPPTVDLNPRENFPTLDRDLGYVVSFTSQIISENHLNENRAGFSVIAISEDQKGIELGFWEDRIWAQEDGDTEPTPLNLSGTLFTQAERIDFDTTKVVKYDLAVKGDRYTLFADGENILEGELRNYAAFEPQSVLGITPPDPYEKSSFLFFGDNTPSASAEVKLSDISVTTDSDNPSFFKIDENSVRGTFVGQVIATDPDSNTLSNWQIIDGNLDVDGDGKYAFAINSNTGNITVNDADDLDFETNPSFQLQVSVSDETNTSNPATVTINLNDAAGSQIYGTSENNRLNGSPEDDFLDGKEGNDFIYGKAGNDTLIGGTGNDNLYGGEGDDSIDGGEGTDTLRETADTNFTLRNDTLGGGELESETTGKDTFKNIERVALSGGNSNNTIDASAYSGNTYLYGRAGNDTLTGGSGNDNLYGGEGDDSINGEAGTDTLRETADTNFTLRNDTLGGGELESETTGKDTFKNIERVALSGGNSNNTIDASAYGGNTYLYGRAGNDSLTGGSGNDNLYGGEGNDTINGGDGVDTLRETADTDFTLTINTLSSAATGTDSFSNIERVVLSGGDSNNTIDASAYSGNAYLYGRAGNDSLTGGSGNDNLYGGEGNDTINGGDGVDTLRETADTDFTLTINTLSSAATGTDSFSNIERVVLSGGDSNNTIDASAYSGNAYLYGRTGNDSLTGGSGNDNLYGGEGNDTINGGDGVDTLRETADTDFTLTINTLSSAATGTDSFSNIERAVLSGGDSNNTIDASAYSGNAYLYGRAGNDSLTGGSGNDNLYGGEGNDTINGGDGVDTLRETADTDFTLTINTLSSAATGTDNFSNIERVVLSGGDSNNTIDASAYSGNAYLYGRAGNDSLTGGSGNDNLYGGEGNDTINGGDGVDTLRETADTDFTLTINTLSSAATGTDSFSNIERVVLSGGDSNNTIDASAYSGNAYLYGRAGNDSLTGGSGNDNLYGGEGNDTINGGDGVDTLRETADTDFTLTINTLSSAATGTDSFSNIERVVLSGGDSNNTIDASAYSGNAYLYGRAGNDSLTGGSGNDLIKAGEGDDLINGGAGNDRLYGEAGKDTFVLGSAQGSDIISDFEVGIDMIGLSDNLLFASLTIEANGDDTKIFEDNNVLATLLNVDSNLINATVFINL